MTRDDRRATFLFAAFSDDQFDWLAERTVEIAVAADVRVVTRPQGGSLTFVSTPGESRFRVWLPLAAGERSSLSEPHWQQQAILPRDEQSLASNQPAPGG